jgi:hypothetical protein
MYLTFRVENSAAPGPQIWPVDRDTGQDIENVLLCEVISKVGEVTKMRIEVAVMNPQMYLRRDSFRRNRLRPTTRGIP